MKSKLSYEKWLSKYFNKDSDHSYWTSIYEKVEVGFAPSDLSHYKEKDLKQCYNKYLDGTEDFLKYKE